MVVLVRRLFARFTRCPHCRQTGHEKVGHTGSLEHRMCRHCRLVYRVAPIAEERRDGDGPSFIVLFTKP